MREVVTLEIGGAGVGVGSTFWQQLRHEHSIDKFSIFHGGNDLQLRYLNTFFDTIQPHQQQQRHIARSILVDTDASNISSSTLMIDNYLPQENIVIGKDHAANVFSKGFGSGKHNTDLAERVAEKCRKMCEAAECVQAVQLIHGVGGGTGSGVTCALLRRLHEEGFVSGAKIVTWTVVPSERVSDKVIEPYNVVLSVPHLAECAHAVHLIDNGALTDRLSRAATKTPVVNFHSLNSLAASVMCNTSACLRFPGQQNTDWRQLYVNLTPVPRLHFLAVGTCEFNSTHGVKAALQDLFRAEKFLVTCKEGRFLSSSLLLRGKFRMSELDSVICDLNRTRVKNPQLPDAIHRAVCDIPPPGMAGAATLLANHTGGVGCLSRSLKQFRSLLNRRAYLHWYDGLEFEEFQRADATTEEMLMEYERLGREGLRFGGIDVNEQW